MKNTVHNLKNGTYLFLLLGLFFTNTVTSATYYAVANAAWNVASTWSATSGGAGGAGIPGAGDIVYIGDTATPIAVTIPATYTASAATLIIGNTANATTNSLTFSAADSVLNVSGNITINKSSSGANTNSLTINTGTATVTGSITMTDAGSATAKGAIVLTTGTLNVATDLVLNGATASTNVVTMGTGTINLTGALTATVGTLTGAVGSTLNFNGGNQTVTYLSALTNVNLTLSGSGTKTLQAGMVAVRNLTVSGTASATTVANLAVGGALSIGNGATLTVGGFTLGVTGTTTVGGGTSGTLNFNSATNPNKTFTGAVTVNAGGVWNETAAITPTFSSTLTNNGTFTASTGTHILNGNLSGVVTIPNVDIQTNLTNNGTFTVTTQLTDGFGRNLTNGTGATINLYGSADIAQLINSGDGGIINVYATNTSIPGTTGINVYSQTGLNSVLNIYDTSSVFNSGQFTPSTSVANTVNYSGSSAQTIMAIPYYHLTTSGSATKTTSGNLSVAGNLLVDTGSTLSHASGTLAVTGTTTVNGTFSNTAAGTSAKTFTGAVTVNAGGVWNMSAAASATTFAGGITSNGTSFNNGTGATTFSTNDQSLSGATSMTFGGAVTLGTSGKTLTNNNTGTVTIGGTLTLTGNFTQGVNSTLALLAAATPFSGAGTFNASTNLNTVNYSGAAQTVKAVTYSNLTLSGSGIKTFGSTAITIANTLTINSGVQANLVAGGSHTTTSLVLGGVGQLPGKSYGGTTSSANVINSTYFTGTTGIINCNCPTYSLTGPNTATTICVSVGTSTVTIKSTVVANLPLGTTYTVTYNTSSPSQTGLTASMTVSPAGTGTFSATGLTTSGSSTVTVTNIANGTCSTAISANNTATVTVNDVPTIAAISAPAALCTGASLNPTVPTVTANGSTVTASGWQLETGVGTGSFANQTMPYTVAFADNGKKIRYYATNGCGTTNSNQVVVTVSAIPTAPVAGTPVQPDCVSSTGSVFLSGLPSGSWTINPGSISGSTASTTVSGLTAGTTYNFTVTNATGCTSPASANVVINAVPGNKTWNGSTWSPAGSPTAVDPVILAGDYNTTTNGDLIACSITINATKKLTITASTFVTIQNDLIINGTLEVLDKGSLVMVNNSGTVTNNGTTTVNRTTTPFEKFDYTYWSTPVTSTDIPSTFTTWRTDRAYEFLPANFLDANLDGFDDNGDDWLYANTMLPGKGYAIMGPTGGTFPATENVVFNGLLNTGTIGASVGLTPGGATDDDWNLIGNPYPCAISADDFINANISGTGTINQTIGGTLYFWTHKADISANFPGLEAYNFSSADYAMYNLMGGVGTAATSTTGSTDAAVNSVPAGYIASCQGFFVEAEAAGSVTFNNSMRVNSPSTANTQFYRTANSNKTQKTNVSSKDRIWLNMENNSGLFSQQLVGYLPNNTTLGFDNGYDGLLNDAGNDINFYSFIDKDTYKIQGRSSFDQNDQVKLGYSSVVAGTFNIRIDSKDGVFANTNQAVFLEDKLTNTFFDLKSGSYTFATEKGTFNDRFVLRYTDKTLGTSDFEKPENQVLVSVKSKQITINSSADTIDKVVIYDLLGRQIYQKNSVNSNELILSNIVSSHQVLVVKTSLQKGEIVTKKIIY